MVVSSLSESEDLGPSPSPAARLDSRDESARRQGSLREFGTLDVGLRLRSASQSEKKIGCFSS